MKRASYFLVLVAFIFNCIVPPQGLAQSVTAVGLMSAPGLQVPLSQPFTPAYLKGLVVDAKNPFKYDFIIHRGDVVFSEEKKTAEYTKLIKYFLAALAIPDTDQWVNLSPYEQNRIIPDNFGTTEMGRDFLAQDYLLKQISATLTNPDTELGKKFWDGVYARAYEKFGTTDVPPVNVISKVWVTPDHATIYEKNDTVYVLDMHLKVMSERDYLAMKENNIAPEDGLTEISNAMIREVIVPAVEKEVNEGKSFAPIRQAYSGMILAAWYKRALKESILNKVYGDRSKVKGVTQDNPADNQKIWQQYVDAFRQGVLNMIREDMDQYSHEILPRKYFSGGFVDAAQLFDKGQITKVSQLPDMAQEAKSTDVASVLFEGMAETAWGTDLVSPQEKIALPVAPIVSSYANNIFNKALDAFKGKSNPVARGNGRILNGSDYQQLFNNQVGIIENLKNSIQTKGAEWILMFSDVVNKLDPNLISIKATTGYGFILKSDLGKKTVGLNPNDVARVWEFFSERGIVTKDAPGVLELRNSPGSYLRELNQYFQDPLLESTLEAALGERKIDGRKPILIKAVAGENYYYFQLRGEKSLYATLENKMIEMAPFIDSRKLNADQQAAILDHARSLRNDILSNLAINPKRITPSKEGVVLAAFYNQEVTGWLNEFAFTKEDVEPLMKAIVTILKSEISPVTPETKEIALTIRQRETVRQQLANKADALRLSRLISKYRKAKAENKDLAQKQIDSDGLNNPYGGIDFAESNLNMSIKRDGNGVPLPVSEQNFDNIQLDGLTPRILGISPAADMPMFKGRV